MNTGQEFKSDYDVFAPIYDEFISPIKFAYVYAWFCLFGYAKEMGPLLELGCGTGEQTLCFAEQGYEVTGVDISEGMLRVARQKAKEKNLAVEFLQEDITKLSLERKFACVYSSQTVGYITELEEVKKVFQHCWRCLAAGGKLIFEACTQLELAKIANGGLMECPSYYWEYRGKFQKEKRDLLAAEYIFKYKDGRVVRVPLLIKSYTVEELASLLDEIGFKDIRFFDSCAVIRDTQATFYPVRASTKSMFCGARKP
jgi:ubiquinone/menaquinone biosynthesis C-methylase UbiE